MAPDGPLPIETRYFQESKQQAAQVLQESYEQQLARFRSDLAAPKADYSASGTRPDCVFPALLALPPLLFTYQKPGFFEMTHGTKVRLPVVGSAACGKGEFVFSTLCLPGRVGCNRVRDRFLCALACAIATP